MKANRLAAAADLDYYGYNFELSNEIHKVQLCLLGKFSLQLGKYILRWMGIEN